jgi:hypothetical protein
MPFTLTDFYKGRAKNPKEYLYNEAGDLIHVDSKGTVLESIVLPIYRPTTLQEFEEMREERFNLIDSIQREYEQARKDLRDALQSSVPDSEIIILNRRIKEADEKLFAARYAADSYEKMKGIETKYIHFDQRDNDKIMPDLTRLVTFEYPISAYYVRKAPGSENIPSQPVIIPSIETKPSKRKAVLIAPTTVTPSIQNVVVFNDSIVSSKNAVRVRRGGQVLYLPEFSYLSTSFVVPIIFNSKSYNSIYKALYGEIAREYDATQGNTDMYDFVMSLGDYEEAEFTGDAFGMEEPEYNDRRKQLINDLTYIKFRNNTELGIKLAAFTENTEFGVYVEGDNFLGIGITIENKDSSVVENWIGQNILGKALKETLTRIKNEVKPSIISVSAKKVLPKKKPLIIVEGSNTDE